MAEEEEPARERVEITGGRMKKRSQGKAKTKMGRGRKRNRDPERIQSSLATAAEVQEHGNTQPLGNDSESLEDRVNRLTERMLQSVERMRAGTRGIVQSLQMLVTHAQLEFASFLPPTYLLSDINNDLQLIVVQKQVDTRPSGDDGADALDLSTGVVEDGAARPSLNDRVDRLWDFLQQLEVHVQDFIRWSQQWVLVIATHLNLDLTSYAPSAAEFLSDMENVF